MKVIARDIWLCDDCTFYAVNGNLPDDSTFERDAEIEEGLQRLGPHLVPDDYDNEQADCTACGWHGDSDERVDVYTDPEYPDWTEKGCPNCKSTDEVSTRESGRMEFSNIGCDCCNSMLAGSFTRFALLGEDGDPQQRLF